MNFVGIVLFVLAIADAIFAKVYLYQGVNQTVTFKGEELKIIADNSKGTDIGEFIICFGSKPDTLNVHCPKGYASYLNGFNGNMKKHVLKVDRQGGLTKNSVSDFVDGTIKFNDDGSLNVLVHKLPAGATVVLPYAKKWAPKEPDGIDDIREKKVVKSSLTSYIVTGCCFLLILIAIAFIVYFCVIRKKKLPTPAIPAPPPDGVSDESMEDPYVPTSPTVFPRLKKITSKRSPVSPPTKYDVNGRKHKSRTTKSRR